MSGRTESVDVAVVGGGLAGLATAAYVARAGLRVQVLEKAHAAGGRAITQRKGDFFFNVGAHALYLGGGGARVLRELGVSWSGRAVKGKGALALSRDGARALPVGPLSLLSSTLLPGAARLELARMLWRIRSLDLARLQGTSLRGWLDGAFQHAEARELLEALLRLSTYAADSGRQSAGAALAQLQLAFKGGVAYLDGGWQTLVDGLRRVAEASGVEVRTGARALAVERTPGGCLVRLADGALGAARVVIAAAPADAAELLGAQAPSLRRWATEATPIRAACLDLALSRLPRPGTTFALGLDRPLYFSVHSASADLAPKGAALVHAVRYLSPDEALDGAEAELESMLERVQPGWRSAVVERRFLPHLTVSNALVESRLGGLPGRPDPRVEELPDVYLAGDWVGPTGMLADAGLSSARLAASLVLGARTGQAPATAAVG